MVASIEDAGALQPITGLRVEMRLEEHLYRKMFSATIVGPVSVVNKPSFDGMYLLKLDGVAAEKLSVNHVLFLPQVYQFHRGLLFRKGRVPGPRDPDRVSLEKFLLGRNPAIRAIEGRVYTSSHEKGLRETMSFQSESEFSMLSYGVIVRPKTVSE
jgi:hypothetical protein